VATGQGGIPIKNEISRVIANTAYQTYERKLQKEIEGGQVPRHVAIIMDGNRRFAKEFGLSTTDGHLKGKEKLEEVMEWCLELGVKILTVYAFSTENLTRQPEEVEYLMKMFEENFKQLATDERIHKHHIRLTVIGQRDLLPKKVQRAIKIAEDATKDYDSYFYNIAIAYGSRQEIIQAIKQIAQAVKEGKMEVDDIDEDVFS
jgi:tritrans,polycis-undecaprenyl-diphosphate synthase [geranylgeranyl-diphosphate specific]